MKKFKFSLQKVLEYNTHIQRREKEILAVMRAEYNELEGQLAQLMSEYELNRMNYLNKCIKGTSINNIAVMLIYIEMIKKKMKNLKKTMEEKKLLIDKQIDKLVQVSKEKTTTEKLREGKYEQYRACERKSEEKFIEEFIAYINSAVE